MIMPLLMDASARGSCHAVDKSHLAVTQAYGLQYHRGAHEAESVE
jgi:hypothetical protein